MIAKWINAQTVKIVVSGSSFFFCSNVCDCKIVKSNNKIATNVEKK